MSVSIHSGVFSLPVVTSHGQPVAHRRWGRHHSVYAWNYCAPVKMPPAWVHRSGNPSLAFVMIHLPVSPSRKSAPPEYDGSS